MSTKAQETRYLSELRRAIARNRRYPAAARRQRETGTVVVRFVVARSGAISGIGVASSSGSSVLDKAAVETVRRLGRFKPIPPELGRSSWSVRAPITFSLR